METCWVPAVNNLRSYGRWTFAEFTEAYQMESDFAQRVEAEFERMIAGMNLRHTNSEYPWADRIHTSINLVYNSSCFPNTRDCHD